MTAREQFGESGQRARQDVRRGVINFASPFSTELTSKAYEVLNRKMRRGHSRIE
jgi:hypothetical protein